MTAAAHEAPQAARIGPNAITRIAEALGVEQARRVFAHAGLAAYLEAPPSTMVDEREVIALHTALHAKLGERRARHVTRQAGERTARYLLAHRIPRPAQHLLRALPAPLAARLLVRAIAAHAWTFAGSGRFRAQAGHPVVLTITDNPLCRGVRSAVPHCDYYAAVFETLFRELVHASSVVIETTCEARGDAACAFELSWKARPVAGRQRAASRNIAR